MVISRRLPFDGTDKFVNKEDGGCRTNPLSGMNSSVYENLGLAAACVDLDHLEVPLFHRFADGVVRHELVPCGQLVNPLQDCGAALVVGVRNQSRLLKKSTVCPINCVHFYIATSYIGMDNTSWTTINLR